jgi:UDP-galactose transporter
MPAPNGHRYLPSTAVFLVELLKLAICLTVSLYQISISTPRSMTATSLFSNLGNAVFSGDSWKMAIPAFVYTLANSLQYVGISNLDAATFQVVYQFKIIVTAVLSVVMLQKYISTRQWISLILLMIGVAVVSLPEDKTQSLVSSHHTRIYSPRSVNPLTQRLGQVFSGGAHIMKRSATYEGIAEDEWALDNGAGSDIFTGLVATLTVCVCSGFAGVYLEKVMKESTHKTAGLWIRNVQLSVYSLFPAFFIGVVFLDGETVSKFGFFNGYNWVVVVSIVVQSLGGILAAFCIFYADNISKNFAVSASMCLSSLASFVFFDFTATTNVSRIQSWKGILADPIQFMLGTAIVLLATYIYSTSEKERKRLPPAIHISMDEKSPAETQDMSITIPKTPLADQGSISSSRPGSPTGKKRKGDSLGYITKQND